jgi:hypothetical protein
MDLSERFNVVTACNILRVSELQLETPYPIVYAQTVEKSIGPLTLQDSDAIMFKVFLPRRYGLKYIRADMNAIKLKSVTRALKYLGTRPNSEGFMLNIV